MISKDEAYKETRSKSLSTILTEMGFEKDSFMEINIKDTTMKRTDGPDFGGWDTMIAMDRQAVTDGKIDVGITGSNNGVYAAYVPGGKYVVTENPEIIQKLQKELGFQDKGLGVVFSNGDRPADPYYKSQYDKMHDECALINRNRSWENNREAEAKAFDGVEVDGFKFSFGKHSEKIDGWTNNYVGTVKMPDGKEVGITGFSGFDQDNTFGKMSQEFASKNFENKVYSGELKKEDVMKRLDGAEDASKEFEESKKRLDDAKDKALTAENKLKTSKDNQWNLDSLSQKLNATMESFNQYMEKNPKKANKMYAYMNDLIQSTAKGQSPKAPNPMEPQGFFGKMKANLFGRKRSSEEYKLEDELRSLKIAIQKNPEIIKESLDKGQKDITDICIDVGERKIAAEKETQTCSKQYKDAQDKVAGISYTVAHNALKVAKFNKLKEGVSKIFTAKEIELKNMARETTGIKDINANTGIDKLAEKAKEMEGMTPAQRLAKRMEMLRGTGKQEQKATVKREIDTQTLNKIMSDKTKNI